jgi:hypothetical protein
MPLTERLTLVLEEARATVRQQHTDLQVVRANSNTLLSAAGVVAGLLAAVALRDGAYVTAWTWTTLALFAAVVALVLFVQWPRRFTFSVSADSLLGEGWSLDTRSDEDTMRHLAKYLAQHVDRNQPKISRMVQAYALGLLVFAAQLVSLFVDLATR